MPSGTSTSSRSRQAQVRVICVVSGPQTQMVPEIEQVMLGNGGLLGLEPRSLIAPEHCLDGGWAWCSYSQIAKGNWTLESSLSVPWRNETKDVFLSGDRGGRPGR